MKTILLILLMSVSFNSYSVDQYYNKELVNTKFIMDDAQRRIRFLEDEIFFLHDKVKNNIATIKDLGNYDRYDKELRRLKKELIK